MIFFSFGCGGWTTHVRNLTFMNVVNKAQFRWDWDIILYDEDGSLTGNKGGTAVAADNITLNSATCASSSFFDNGVTCSSANNRWVRFAYNNLKPNQVVIANITNYLNQTVWSPKLAKRLTYKNGFMFALQPNQGYIYFFCLSLKLDDLAFFYNFCL